MSKLEGKKIAILATEGVEQVELVEPRKALESEGAQITLVSLEEGEFQGFDHLDKADTFTADKAVADCSADDFDGVLIPGGVANGDFLRADEDAVRFVRAFFDAGKPVAAICHAPWILAEADVVRGRSMTSFPSLKTDLRNAGAEWVDEEVVVDQGLVTSRKPDDIPAFSAKAIEEFCEGKHGGQRPSGRDARIEQDVAAGHA
ncbi:type 1 glutamine amidotransferase domain-containing protein [Conexibacter sp. SYSU D00693]|uniref:type 1 glutamine amidotransferase domain-containing protein n=1 Tax=Conexibacter sp. SYSU D00693 TaxID=2812560 RepID=UPI00196A2775|nr:type 1 glutamine amidotransferase domain-containing protein [Conexibacter sp. SYSU D00693]